MVHPKPLIYLNNAATSWPKPPEVQEAILRSLDLPVFGSGRTAGTEGEDYVTEAREAIADFFNTGPEKIIFTQNATDSLNLLISGFLAKEMKKCHVLTTTLEHNSVLRPLHEYERLGLIHLTVLPAEGLYITPDLVKAAIRDDTRLMVMTHGSNVLGSVQDIQSIGRVLQDHGVFFIVDGAQTAGHIPINLSESFVDAFVFTGHKALLGTSGTGGFYLKDPKSIAKIKFGGTGTNSVSLFQPDKMPEKFEIGTQNYLGLAALSAGVRFIEKRGFASITAQAKRQSLYIIGVLKEQENIILYNENPDLPIISFTIQGVLSDDIGFILARVYNIIVRSGLHCAPLVHKAVSGGEGSVRLSLSCFTTDEECRVAANAIVEISKDANPSFSSA